MNISKKKVQLITGLVNTLLGTNISHEKSILNLEDDFPFPQVGYVNFLEGIGLHRDKSQDFVPQRWKGFVFRSKPGLHPMRRGEQKKRRNLQCQMEGWDCWWSAWNILKSLKSSLQAWFALRRWCAKFWKYGCSILQPLPASFRPHMLICHCFSEIFSHAKLAKKTCFANECLIQRFAPCSSTMPEKNLQKLQ